MPETAPFSRLYPIVDATLAGDEDAAVSAVLSFARAGLRTVQLRAKSSSAEAFWRMSVKALTMIRGTGARLIVNDRADVALLAQADGVHVGQDDLSAEATRRIVGPGRIIGLSTHSAEQARDAGGAPIDYVAIGPIFDTATKTSGIPPLGLEGVRAARRVVKKPLVAIGGITLDRAPSVLTAGADGVAVVSALWSPIAERRDDMVRQWVRVTES
ncbi:MAG TPA: thiamine phosphate synthase [Vicinamibacteria bacterium]|nr:thiamine phosphate synthase [Vicinamibacteria bacterium]